MSDVGKWLRDADPLAHEAGLSDVDVQVMRRATMAAAEPRGTASLWPGPLLVATTVAVTLAAGVIVGRRLPAPRGVVSVRGPVIGPSTDVAGSHVSARRQLQFATPGGTRVIWVFDPEFKP